MVDVSADGGCTITPINPTTLTAAGGAMPSGTENVMINCNCTASDGTVVDIVRWSDPDGNRLRLPYIAPDTPYSRKGNDNTDNTNVLLIIPTFNDSYDGTYTCGRYTGGPTGVFANPMATVTLTIASELMINTVSYRMEQYYHIKQ